VSGYLTVFLKIKDKQTNEKKQQTIEHTHDENKERATDEFINNIINMYKTLKSDSSQEFISAQKGGTMINMDKHNYKNKYLKYKSKYLTLKKYN
jgi:hypothetical protein